MHRLQTLRRLAWLPLLVLSACTTTAQPVAKEPSLPPPRPTETAVATAPQEPSLPPPRPATEEIEPTVVPATSTMVPPTSTPLPPTSTPDRWAAYAQYTIDGLGTRSYGTGTLEMVRVMEETPTFTRWLVAYPSDGLRITGMLNRPKGDGPFPVVLLSHGYYPLDVYQTGNGTKLAADYLAQRGFLTISPDFRSHAESDDAPNVFRAGHVIDLLNLIPLAQALPEAQPGKVGLWGHSNGGAITAKALVISDQIAGAVVYAPASLTIEEDYWFRVERAQARGGTIDPIEWPVAPADGPDLYQRLSPLPYLERASAPVQIHYGTADETVPAKWPGDLYAGLLAANKQVAYYEYPGQPHSFQGTPNQTYLQRIAAFYAEVLGRVES